MDTVKRKAGKRAIRTVVPMLFLLLASCLHAQDRQYKFRLIDASDGLSDGQIRSLTMTEEGCIAIKTGFILNIYNGATFDRFPYDKTRKYIWAYDRPPKEYYDREGRMWLKELGYLLLLDMKSGQYDYSVSEVLASMGINQRLKNLFIDDYKNYWFVTEDNTVSFYDVEQGRLRTIEDGGSEFTRKYGVPVEMTQYMNLCWIVYESGLIRYWDYSSAEFVSQETRFLHAGMVITQALKKGAHPYPPVPVGKYRINIVFQCPSVGQFQCRKCGYLERPGIDDAEAGFGRADPHIAVPVQIHAREEVGKSAYAACLLPSAFHAIVEE